MPGKGSSFASLRTSQGETNTPICVHQQLAAPETDYAELSSKLVGELEGAALNVVDILEEECRDLFSVVATRDFSHLLLRDPGFNFSEVIIPVPAESREGLAEAVEDHVSVLLGKFSCSGNAEPGEVGYDDGDPSS